MRVAAEHDFVHSVSMSTSSVLKILRQLAGADSLDGLEETVGYIGQQLRAQCAIYRFDTPSVLKTAVGELSGNRAYPAELLGNDPMHALARELTPKPRVHRVSDLIPKATLQASEAYRYFYQPNRLSHVMSLWFDDRPFGAVGCTGLFVGRDRAFERSDSRFLGQLLDAFVSVARRSERWTAARARDEAVSTFVELRANHPIVVANASGGIDWMSARAQPLLGASASLPPVLAAAVMSLFDETRSPMLSVRLSPAVVADLQIVHAHGRRYVLIEIIEEAGKPLSRAELAVLRLLEQGLSQEDAARALGVHVETVRSQTKSIYKKRGVSSRAELLASRRLS